MDVGGDPGKYSARDGTAKGGGADAACLSDVGYVDGAGVDIANGS